MKLFKICVVFSVCVVALLSCSKQPAFTVTGKISDIQSDTLYLYLEKRDFNASVILDSVKLDRDGAFVFNAPSPEYPDLYILRLGNQAINLSVDSIETITVNASQNGFALDYNIEGSDNSSSMKDVALSRNKLQQTIVELREKYLNKSISASEYQAGLEEAVENYKSVVKKLILTNLKSPAAYFALFQKVDDILIFNPYEKDDSRIYSAVATAWDTYYKETPRAKYLRDFTINAIRERKSLEKKSGLIENMQVAESSAYFKIVLPDINDKMVSLESLKGKVVLLDFTVYQAEYSPIHSININETYQRNKDNMAVYQVSFDADLHFWKNAASNLPWICVHEDKSTESELIKRFNIQELPTMYLLNKEGELVKKLKVSDNIEAEVKKLL
ncbi:thioredoxin-like domain-containing protein [Viscerimonas tarda]